MAHGITMTNGKAEMAYVGDEPWHGLGQKLADNATIEQWQMAAGMDWKIRRSKVRYAVEQTGSEILELPESHVLFRSDTNAPLGIVSSKYKTVQPAEVMEFFRDLTESNGFKMDTAGTLFGGKRFWALASIGESACIVGNDQIDGYLLLSTSSDGTLATTARFTTVRVVCNNTLGMALKGNAKREIVVSHRSVFDADRVKNELGIARDAFGDFLKEARHLAKTRVKMDEAEAFIATLLKDTKTVVSEDVSKTKPYQKIMDLFTTTGIGHEMAGADGTAWGLVNAVTEYVDHHVKAKSDSHRLSSAWFGRGDNLKTAALIAAHQL